MLIHHSGIVIPTLFPYVNATMVAAEHSKIHNFASYACRGSKLLQIIGHCWGCGLSAYDTLLICSVNGFAFCVTEPVRKREWAALDAGYAAMCDEYQMPCDPVGYADCTAPSKSVIMTGLYGSQADAAIQNAAVYGTGFMLDGKSIDPSDVYIKPKAKLVDPLMQIIEAAYHCCHSEGEIHAAIKAAGLPETSDETIMNLLGEYAESITE